MVLANIGMKLSNQPVYHCNISTVDRQRLKEICSNRKPSIYQGQRASHACPLAGAGLLNTTRTDDQSVVLVALWHSREVSQGFAVSSYTFWTDSFCVQMCLPKGFHVVLSVSFRGTLPPACRKYLCPLPHTNVWWKAEDRRYCRKKCHRRLQASFFQVHFLMHDQSQCH